MATDMIARLGVNAEEFSRGVQTATAGLGPAMEKAGREAASKFDSALTPGLKTAEQRIRKTLSAATISTNDNGLQSLNLDVAGLRAGAAAAQLKADAARQLVVAMDAVNRSTQNVTKAQQLELAAAQSVAQKYEEQARDAIANADALGKVQAQLATTGANAQTAATGLAKTSKEAGGLRMATIGAGQQLNDIIISLQGGQRASTVFAQQLPQLALAMSYLEGSSNKTLGALGKFGTFLSGPWGLIVPIASIALGLLSSKMGQVEESSAGALRGMNDAAKGFDTAAAAAARYSSKLDELLAKHGRLGRAEIGTAKVQLMSQEADLAALDRRIAAGPDRKKFNLASVASAMVGGSAEVGVDVASTALRQERDRLASAVADARGKIRAIEIQTTNRERYDASLAQAANDNKANRKAEADAKREAGKAERESQRLAKEAAREAERLKEQEQRRYDTLKGIVQTQQDEAAVAKIRVEQGDVAADVAAARLALERQFPEYAGKTTEELAAQLKLSKEVAQTRKDDFEKALSGREKAIRDREDDRKAQEFVDEEYSRGEAIFRNKKIERDQAQQEIEERIDELAYYFEDIFHGGFKNLWQQFEYEGKQAMARLAAEQVMGLISGKGDFASLLGKAGISQKTLQTITGNAGLGAMGAGMTGGSSVGGMAGGAIGGAAMKELFGSALGGMAGPLGSVVGGVLGGAIGGLLKKSKYGTAVLTGNDSAATVTGNSSGLRGNAGGAAGSVQEGLAEIAEMLGADVGSYRVSIGQYKDNWRVSTTGRSGKLNFKGDTSGLYDFGDDQQAAIAYAIQDALSDGAITGISAAAQNILKSGQDLQKAIEKAVNIESIPKQLKAQLDPLGYALDEVDDKYKKLAATLKEAGASSEQVAQAQQLWKLERAEVIKSVGSVSDGLKSFLQSLRAGDSSPLSLREQQVNAGLALDPFRKAIEAGQAIDTDAFQQAAQTFLAVERQISGSTQDYFAQYNLVTGLMEKAIAQIDANASGTDAAVDPFSEMIATATQASANILEQQNEILSDMKNLWQQALDGNPGLSDFLTANRNMAA